MTMCMLLSMLPVQLQAASKSTPLTSTPGHVPMSPEVTVMVTRLQEIRDMDMSTLEKSEKKQLRQEVKQIKGDLKAAGEGVYLSAGAIIIIILLLILIL